MKRIVSDKDCKCYTKMKKVLEKLELTNKDYWWLISDAEFINAKNDSYDLFFNDGYELIKTADLVKILDKNDYQWIWGVFSAIPTKYSAEEILQYDLPYLQFFEEGEYNPYYDEPKLQHPLAEFEIYAVDSTEMFIVTGDEKLIDRFKKNYPRYKLT